MNVLNNRQIIIVIMVLVVLILFLIIFMQVLRNNQRKCRTKEMVGITIDAKVVSWKYLLGRPTRYIVNVEYYVNNEKISKTLVTSGKFAAKYERERDIQIVVIPNTRKVYFAEENWRMQNIGLIIAIMFIAFILCFLFLYVLFWLTEGTW